MMFNFGVPTTEGAPDSKGAGGYRGLSLLVAADRLSAASFSQQPPSSCFCARIIQRKTT